MPAIPPIRVESCNEAPLRIEGDFVLYWMIAFRRTRWNYALQHAAARADELRKPLVVFEPLRCDYPWASDRLHAFVIDGMRDNAAACSDARVAYYPYVEPAKGAGKGLLAALAGRASLIVTDDYPCFFLPRMVEAAARRVGVRMERVDANGLLPIRHTSRLFTTAASYRRHFQREFPSLVDSFPEPEPLTHAQAGMGGLGVVPDAVLQRWPAASAAILSGSTAALQSLPVDHAVGPVATRGGSRAAQRALALFAAERLRRYPDDRNQPEIEGTSRLSPYLHFGHISTHEVFSAVMTAERWTTRTLPGRASGAREGWWGAGAGAEAFLDQLCVWRELGLNFCAHQSDYDRFESLPAWARATLTQHAGDLRPIEYPLDRLDAADTYDLLWNAAMGQLRTEGWFHSYLRMLWGKKLLEWSDTPQTALDRMIALMNRYSLDGRDPNAYSGAAWTLGRYDRPWFPERPIFGTIRFMSSANTVRKLRVKKYIAKYGAKQPGLY